MYENLLRKQFKQQYLIVSSQLKLILALIIFLLSIFSGVEGVSQSVMSETVLVRQANILGASIRNDKFQIVESKPAVQVSSVAIVSKKKNLFIISPTPTRAPNSNTSLQEKNTEKITTDKQAGSNSGNAIFSALNEYRAKNGKPLLAWDGGLANYAQSRAELYKSQGSLDGHAGFNDFIKNQDGFKKLGFLRLGENSGYGHNLDANSLIEQAYGMSPAHNENQLNRDWTHVGIGTAGSATNFIFGGNKR